MAARTFFLSVFIGSAALGAFAAFSGCSGDDDSDNAVHPDAAVEAGDAATDAADIGPVTKGDRLLGINVAVDNQQFNDGVIRANDAGATVDDVTFAWDDVERPDDAGTADAAAFDGGTPTSTFNPLVHVTNLVLSTYGVQALLALPVVDASGSRAPVELKARAFDDPELAARYDMMTDYVFDTLTEDTKIPGLLVGTEIDVAFGQDAKKYEAFTAFVAHVATHVHAKYPGTKVGFTVRASNLSANASRLSAAWAASDIVAISLLPGFADARAGAPEDVGAAFDSVAAAAPSDRPIWIHEVGTPTDTVAFGSEASQAAFVRAAFAAWDKHAARVPVVVFRELLDTQTDVATALAARYGRTDAAFIAYLSSLGLQSTTAQPKPSFAALKQEAAARGF